MCICTECHSLIIKVLDMYGGNYDMLICIPRSFLNRSINIIIDLCSHKSQKTKDYQLLENEASIRNRSELLYLI